jgi:hypothetical protein
MRSTPSDHVHAAPSAVLNSTVGQLELSPIQPPTERSFPQSDSVMEEARRKALPSTASNRSTVDGAGTEKTPKAEYDGSRRPVSVNGVNPKDKRSTDYILRSGLAGGMAGCAVSLPCNSLLSWLRILTDSSGKNDSSSVGPRQDSLPSVESGVCQVFRKLVWVGVGHTRYQTFRRSPGPLQGSLGHPAANLPLRRDQVFWPMSRSGQPSFPPETRRRRFVGSFREAWRVSRRFSSHIPSK